MTDDATISPDALPDPMYELGRTVDRLQRLLADPAVSGAIGSGLKLEFTCAIVAFRSRFHRYLPQSQQDLFSAAEPSARPRPDIDGGHPPANR